MSVKQDIKSNNFKSVYLIHGEDNFLKDYYRKALAAKLLKDDFSGFNSMDFVGVKPDVNKIKEFLASYPFMSEKKVVSIRNSDLFKKASDSEKKDWLDVFSSVPDYAVIIFEENEIDKRGSLYKALSDERFSIDEFPYQKDADLNDWIRRYLASLGKEIGQDASAHLIKSCSTSMYILKNELDKLASFTTGNEVKISDIDKCACKIPEDKVFDMIESIISGNTKDAYEKYNDLKLLRQEPIKIIAAINSKFSMMKKVKTLSPEMSTAEIASLTGQKEYFIRKSIESARKVSLNKINEIILLCADSDHLIKSIYADGWALLDVLIAKMI